jgi:hypothetical protein
MLCAETHVGYHIKSDFNQNWNVLTKFGKEPQYQISQKMYSYSAVVKLLHAETWTDRHDEDNRHIHATSMQMCQTCK